MAEQHAYQAVIDAIKAIITDTSLKVYIEDVINRLVSFGYVPSTADAWAIAYEMSMAQHHVQNTINASKIPDEAKEILIDMICGSFLSMMNSTGRLAIETIDLSGVVSSIHEGDTTVNFGAGMSDAEKFGKLVAWLMTGREGDLICFRKIRW